MTTRILNESGEPSVLKTPLRIFVVDVKSHPIPGVAVRLARLHYTRNGSPLIVDVETDVYGRATLIGLPTGRYSVQVRRTEAKFAIESQLDVTFPKTATLKLVLPPSGSVSVRVLMKGGGALDPPTFLSARQLHDGHEIFMHPDVKPDGTAIVDRLNAGIPVRVEASTAPTHQKWKVIDLQAGAPVHLDIPLERIDLSVVSVRGRVSRAGTPLSGLGILVTSLEPLSDGFGVLDSARTGAGGDFVFHDLAAATYRVTAYFSNAVTKKVPEPQTRDVAVQVGQVSTVDFKV